MMDAGFSDADHLHAEPGFATWRKDGSLAQLVERFVYTEDVGSSSLSRPTIPLSRATNGDAGGYGTVRSWT